LSAPTVAIALTNNPSVSCQDPGIYIQYLESPVLGVIQEAQRLIYEGYKLLTHPLAGNWQMNVTPYRSLLLKKSPEVDDYSLRTINKCLLWISAIPQAGLSPDKWPTDTLEHYQLIDQDIFNHVVGKYRIAPDTY
jgi:hypothetical protein